MTNLDELNVKKLSGRKAIFLLGTDQYIGEGLDENGNEKESETRIGVTPEQVKKIKNWLELNGVALDFFFVKGAGTRAGFLDSEYLKIGGQPLFEHQLSTMPAPNVVHALKEPSTYEAFIPGPFLRIGALHSGAIDDTSGVAFLFKRRNFCAIFDGSNIGTADGRNIPIRGAMSVFAGEIAAEFTADHFSEKGITHAKVVISGGGVVGKAALRRLLEITEDRCRKIILVEPNEHTVEELKTAYNGKSAVEIFKGNYLTTEQVKTADSVILTAFRKGFPAPDVLMFDDISQMSNSSIIVDVSIDEKGGIKLNGFEKERFSLPEVVDKVSKEISKLGKGITYIADDHLPKHKPKKASVAHGEAIMPYIAVLLFCSAELGGARQVAKYILDGDFSAQDEKVRELLEHLKCGLAFYSPAPVKYSSSIISDNKNKEYLENFFKEGFIEFETFE